MRVSLRGLYPQYTFFSGRDIGVRQSDHRTSSARRRDSEDKLDEGEDAASAPIEDEQSAVAILHSGYPSGDSDIADHAAQQRGDVQAKEYQQGGISFCVSSSQSSNSRASRRYYA
jgi:hypothetical protein